MLDLLLCGQDPNLREASLSILREHFTSINIKAQDLFLILAVEQNLVSLTLDLLDSGASLEAIDRRIGHDHETALEIAVQNGRAQIVQMILERKPELANVRENYRNTSKLLDDAVKNGNIEIVKMLLERMSSEIINAEPDHYGTSLHYAAINGNTEIFKMLLERMTLESINIKNHLGQTVLHLAAKNGKIELVKMILERFPESINARSKEGGTSLHYAAINGNIEIVKMLLGKMSAESINTKNEYGQTALHRAAIEENAELGQLLLEKMTQESINAKDNWKRTASDWYLLNYNPREIINLIQQRLIALEGVHRGSIELIQTAYHDAPLKFIRFIKGLEENGHSFTKGEENPFRDINIRDQWSDREKVGDYLQQESRENPAKSNLEIIIDQGELKDLSTALSFKTSLTTQEKTSIQAKYPEQANALLEQIKPKGWYLGKHLSGLSDVLDKLKISGIQFKRKSGEEMPAPTSKKMDIGRKGPGLEHN